MNNLDTIAFLKIGSLICFVVLFAVWERRWPARPRRTTIKAFDLLVVLNVGVFSLACKLLLTPSNGFAAAPLGGLPIAAKFAAALLIIDFTLYWIHRGMHSSLLWNTHRFHHSIREVNWLKGIYVSGTHITMYVAPQIIFGYYLFGFSRLEMALVVVVGYFVQLWQHANVNVEIGGLKYMFVTPQFHRVHHALMEDKRDRNFGAVLSLWDVIFGTYVDPTHEDYEFGVDEQVPLVRGLLGI